MFENTLLGKALKVRSPKTSSIMQANICSLRDRFPLHLKTIKHLVSVVRLSSVFYNYWPLPEIGKTAFIFIS